MKIMKIIVYKLRDLRVKISKLKLYTDPNDSTDYHKKKLKKLLHFQFIF